jgi:hypothetical protein
MEDDSPGRLAGVAGADVVDVCEEAATGQLLRVAPEMFETGVSVMATALAATAFASEGGIPEDSPGVVAALVAPDTELPDVHVARGSGACGPGPRIRRATSASSGEEHEDTNQQARYASRSFQLRSILPTRRGCRRGARAD